MRVTQVLLLLLATTSAIQKYKRTSNAKMAVMGDIVDWENGEIEDPPHPQARTEAKPLKGSAVDQSKRGK